MTRQLTRQVILDLKPCEEGVKWLNRLWPADRETWSVAEMLRHPSEGPISYALWLTAHTGDLLIVQTWALDCAERASDHPAIAVARRYLRGEATLEELQQAQTSVAYAAYAVCAVKEAADPTFAAYFAALAAYCAAAAYAAAHFAADAFTAVYDERVWQRQHFIELLEQQP